MILVKKFSSQALRTLNLWPSGSPSIEYLFLLGPDSQFEEVLIFNDHHLLFEVIISQPFQIPHPENCLPWPFLAT